MASGESGSSGSEGGGRGAQKTSSSVVDTGSNSSSPSGSSSSGSTGAVEVDTGSRSPGLPPNNSTPAGNTSTASRWKKEEEDALVKTYPAFLSRGIPAAAVLPGQPQLALMRGLAAGVLAAALTSAFFMARSSAAAGANIVKKKTFLIGSGTSFCVGFLAGWTHTNAKLRAHERRLAKLQEAAIPNMSFLAMDSLAPPLPADSYTAAGEEAAAQLLQAEQQQRNQKRRGV